MIKMKCGNCGNIMMKKGDIFDFDKMRDGVEICPKCGHKVSHNRKNDVLFINGKKVDLNQ